MFGLFSVADGFCKGVFVVAYASLIVCVAGEVSDGYAKFGGIAVMLS